MIFETVEVWVTIDEAQQIVESISDREMPLIWEVGSVKRVLDLDLSMLEKTLVLLYSSAVPLNEIVLVESLEHSNPSVYRRDILRKAHKARLLEYAATSKSVTLSPLGARRVEDEILAKAKS